MAAYLLVQVAVLVAVQQAVKVDAILDVLMAARLLVKEVVQVLALVVVRLVLAAVARLVRAVAVRPVQAVAGVNVHPVVPEVAPKLAIPPAKEVQQERLVALVLPNAIKVVAVDATNSAVQAVLLIVWHLASVVPKA